MRTRHPAIIRRRDLSVIREQALHAAQRSVDEILWFEAWMALAKAADCLAAMMARGGLVQVDVSEGEYSEDDRGED